MRPHTFIAARHAYLLVVSVCLLAGLSPSVYGGANTVPQTGASVAELEALIRRIADPHQRDELLSTLQAFLAAAMHGQAATSSEAESDLLAKPSQGLFFAIGEFTQRLAVANQRLISTLIRLPSTFSKLPRRVQEPATRWAIVATALALSVVGVLGMGLRLCTRRWEKELRTRIAAADARQWQWKAWLALLVLGVASALWMVLLACSSVVFSLLPLGSMPAGVVTLVIVTGLLYGFFRAVARLLLEPEQGLARLLPLNDQIAQQAWRWASRLIALVTLYFVLTRMLLTIGIAEEFYHAVRGVMTLVLATVVSVLLAKMGRRGQGLLTSSEGESGLIRPKVWAEVRRIWPSLAIIYV